LAVLPVDVNDAERLSHDPAMRWIARSKARAGSTQTYFFPHTVLNYSITLQPQGAGVRSLVQFTPTTGDPKIHWLNDDTLKIDLGK
jgi:hypothetical protein